MTMTIRDMINELEQFAEEHGDDCEVRLAHQPRWAFEYSISSVVAVDLNEPDPDDVAAALDVINDPETDDVDRAQARAILDGDEKKNVVVYIGEGTQLGYLPGVASNAVWQ